MAVAALGLALGIAVTGTLRADTFGTTGNEFTIDFVDIGNAGNTADSNNFGTVIYNYRIGTYEVSQNAITKATASGMTNVTAGAWTGNRTAANISWFEAAAFTNWLNTSTGHQAAYDLTWNGSAWTMSLWSLDQAWVVGGENRYRNKDAYYFLPGESEWYKAAYYNSAGSNYYDYATGSNTAPTATTGSTNADTAVYTVPLFSDPSQPARVDSAGGLSAYGTMGQSGNVWEWTESMDGTADNPNASRMVRGGDYLTTDTNNLSSGYRLTYTPTVENASLGFRVASVGAVPEPASGLLMLVAGGAYWLARRRSGKR